ncbi:methionine synthase [Nocardioides euryhalodurans]|uniref:Methionine synthase n=1 Tax=Nocardioides euryhalodurans TaxID=2518370 RepID=A0A4P7GP00_9ACTN|nr:methionine synthase [Nocardioides euryhalodurans]QBR93956.1 methionine synthase [Nocardioides euryhalodurans]
MTLATGIGSHPGEDATAYAEAVRVVLGELSDDHGLPYVPELPGRGAGASMTGRAVAAATDLAFDLQPAGWRLTDREGVDQRRARSLLAQDLDQVEEQGQGYVGPYKTQVTGPWTLAATVERPRGDRVLADHGARRDLAQALAEGVRRHLADLRRRLPGVDRWVVQLDEPVLASVLEGRVPTASGFGRHRVVQPPEASAALGWVAEAIAAEGAETWVHSCAPGTPLDLVRGAGVQGLLVDPAVLSPGDHDDLAAALEAGGPVALGVVPTRDPATAPTEASLTESVLRWLDMVGLEPGPGLVVSPGCGLTGATSGWARQALALAAATARHLDGG